MLDFGFSEIVLTSAIALIVLGPEKLPKVARQVGNWMGRARAMARQLTDQLEREVNAEDLMRQTRKSNPTQAGGGHTAISTAPVPFDTSYTPPSNAAPEGSSAPVPSAHVTSTPHGADWHPSPPENKSPDG